MYKDLSNTVPASSTTLFQRCGTVFATIPLVFMNRSTKGSIQGRVLNGGTSAKVQSQGEKADTKRVMY